MRSLVSLALVASLFALAARSDASAPRSASVATVCGYFEALNRNDFGRALALTVGDAETRTRQILGNIQRQANAADAEIELHVRKLAVAERAPAAGAVPVDVVFDIDVVGKKWLFSKVARKLAGKAQFVVAPASQPRIVAIVGSLE